MAALATVKKRLSVIKMLLKHRYPLTGRGAAADRLMKHLGLYELGNRPAEDAVGQKLHAIHANGSRLELKR